MPIKKFANISKMCNKKTIKAIENPSSDSDSDSGSDYITENSDDEDVDDEDGDNLDVHEYRKFLSELFPSNHINSKVKAGEKLKKVLTEEVNKKIKPQDNANKRQTIDKQCKTKQQKDAEKQEKQDKQEKQEKKKPSKTKPEKIESSDSDESDEECKNTKSKLTPMNILFTINDSYEDIDEEYETCSNATTENEDDPISSDEEDSSDEDDEDSNENDQKPDLSNDAVLSELTNLLSKHPNNESIKKCVEKYETDLQNEMKKKNKKNKKEKERNSRIFKKIIRRNVVANEIAFYNKLDVETQKSFIKQLREINKTTNIEKPYSLTILESDIPLNYKAYAIQKINGIRDLDSSASDEYHKTKHWIDGFMKIPFNQYKSLPVSIDNGIEPCHDFMISAQNTLNEAVYGLDDAKMQIMQVLGQLITNPKSVGSSIAICGPPGTGKTSLVKEGISKILNRPFAFIALGGATDSCVLEGHSYTYVGSTWGKIVQILMDSKCMNPIIYFDELDKISDTPRGEEITGILTHLTDTSQNSQFHDKYFSEIEFDLSKCLFIFSYNDESKVNPILRDRMYKINTKGYDQQQKTIIANNYLLPKIREQVKFNSDEIIIPEKTIQYIVEYYCDQEKGVRNLKRCLEIIHTKLNLYRLMRPGTNMFEKKMTINVTFPITITNDIVSKLLTKTDALNPSLYGLYV